MQINLGARKINCKIIYYGPGFSGKTTNIQKVHDLMPSNRKSDLTSIATEGDRTLFFDFMSLDLGQVMGMDTCFQLYTVPGQVYYNATRKLVLQGVDGLVFVADCSPDQVDANVESWNNLVENLAEYGLTLDNVPIIIQFNKRDVHGAVPTEQLNSLINKKGFQTFEAVACNGQGVLATLKAVCSMVFKAISDKAARNRNRQIAQQQRTARPAPTTPTMSPQPQRPQRPAQPARSAPAAVATTTTTGTATITRPDSSSRIATVALNGKPGSKSVNVPHPVAPTPVAKPAPIAKPASIAKKPVVAVRPPTFGPRADEVTMKSKRSGVAWVMVLAGLIAAAVAVAVFISR